MDFDLQRFYNINRRALMWIAFFAILYALRDFFAIVFITFIFAYVMGRVAWFVTQATKAPFALSVSFSYLVVIGLIGLLVTTTIPTLAKQGADLAHTLPEEVNKLAWGIKNTAARYDVESTIARYINKSLPPKPSPTIPAPHIVDGAISATSQPAEEPEVVKEKINTKDLVDYIQNQIIGSIPGAAEKPLTERAKDFGLQLLEGTFEFILAVVLSFLIVLDFDHLKRDLNDWSKLPVGRFFSEAAASVIRFSQIVGHAFQCQMVIALLNASITGVGLLFLGIEPLLLLTSLVFIFGLIPVLGVFISSVPIVLIAFNTAPAQGGGLGLALIAIGVVTFVHLLEAYVFNPRIYAARFHLNPVIVLIILLVGHKMAGVWGMLLGIPITHYILTIAQVPQKQSRSKTSKEKEPAAT